VRVVKGWREKPNHWPLSLVSQKIVRNFAKYTNSFLFTTTAENNETINKQRRKNITKLNTKYLAAYQQYPIAF